MQINITVFYKLMLSFWMCLTRHAQSTQNKKFAYLWNITRKTWGMKLICCLHINTKIFHKFIVSHWVCIARHAQSTQNNMFAISLQYLKENVKYKFDFLPADKHESYLQIDTLIFDGDGQVFPMFPKQQVCNVLAISQKRS